MRRKVVYWLDESNGIIAAVFDASTIDAWQFLNSDPLLQWFTVRDALKGDWGDDD